MKNKMNLLYGIVLALAIIVSYSNITSAQDFVFENESEDELIRIHSDNGNLTVGGDISADEGFFSALGSISNRITSLFVQDVDASGNVSASWFNGLFNWTSVSSFLTFDGSNLDFDDSAFNSTYDNRYHVTGKELSDNLNWTFLQNYPTGCAAGQAIQVIDDTLTCINISAQGSDNLDGYDSSFFMPLNKSVFGDFDFNGGWSNGGLSIVDGDLYAQTGFFYDISSLEVSNLKVNGSLIPDIHNSFDIGNSTTQWRNIFLSGNANISGNIYQNGNQVLDTATNFGGDVSGTYNAIQIGANVIGDNEVNYTQVTLADFTNDAQYVTQTFGNATYYLASNPDGYIDWSQATNGTLYLSSNPQGFINWGNAVNGTLIPYSDESNLNVNSSNILVTSEGLIDDVSDILGSDITNDLNWINATQDGTLNVNSSDYWDGLNTPEDINAADITDDGTYLLATGDTATGNYTFDTSTLFIDSNSNFVGVGTVSPSAPFHLRSATNNIAVFEHSSATGTPLIAINQDGTRRSYIRYQDSGDQLDLVNEYGPLTLWSGTSGSESQKVTILGDGNVGIGVTSPEARLHLRVNDPDPATPHASANLIIEDTGTNYINLLTDDGSATGILFGHNNDNDAGRIGYESSSDYMYFSTNGGERLRITNTGDIGIGITSPQTSLHVNGSAIFNGTINTDGNRIINIANGTSAQDAVTLSQLQTVNSSATAAETDPSWSANYSGLNPDQIIFGQLEQDGNLTWNKTEKRLGVGTDTPQNTLNVQGDANVTGTLYVNEEEITPSTNVSILHGQNASATIVPLAVDSNGALRLNISDGSTGTNILTAGATGVDLTLGSNLSFTTSGTGIVWSDGSYQLTSGDNLYAGIEWDYNQTTAAINSILGFSYYNSTDFDINNYYLESNPFSFVNTTTASDLNNLVILSGANITDDGTYLLATGDTATGNYTFDTSTLFIDSSSNRVGIGTDSPNGKIHAVLDTSYSPGSGWDSNAAVFGQAGNTGGAFSIAYDDTNGTQLSSIKPGTAWKPIHYYANSHQFYYDGPTNLGIILNSDGNVGINTTTPNQKLQVIGNVNISGTLYANNISSNSPLQLQTGGTTRLYINDSTGNVGIGTSSPDYLLEVIGGLTDPFVSGVFGNNNTGGYGGIGVYGENQSHIRFWLNDSAIGNPDWQIRAGDSAGGDKLQIYSWTQADNLMTLDGTTGNVGIGTSSPENLLSLQLPSGTNGNILSLARNAGAYFYHLGISSDSKFQILDNDGTTVRFNINPTTGNVGIGTTSPQGKLDVAGDIVNTDGSSYLSWNIPAGWTYTETTGLFAHSYSSREGMQARAISWTGGSLAAGNYAEFSTTFTAPSSGTYIFTATTTDSRIGDLAGYWYARIYLDSTSIASIDVGNSATTFNNLVSSGQSLTGGQTYTIRLRLYLNNVISGYQIDHWFGPVAVSKVT